MAAVASCLSPSTTVRGLASSGHRGAIRGYPRVCAGPLVHPRHSPPPASPPRPAPKLPLLQNPSKDYAQEFDEREGSIYEVMTHVIVPERIHLFAFNLWKLQGLRSKIYIPFLLILADLDDQV